MITKFYSDSRCKLIHLTPPHRYTAATNDQDDNNDDDDDFLPLHVHIVIPSNTTQIHLNNDTEKNRRDDGGDDKNKQAAPVMAMRTRMMYS